MFSTTSGAQIGYALTLRPVLRAGIPFRRALQIVLASDTASMSVMEIADNAFILLVPGALAAGLGEALFWWSPLNRWLIARGKGHAVAHRHHVTRSIADLEFERSRP